MPIKKKRSWLASAKNPPSASPGVTTERMAAFSPHRAFVVQFRGKGQLEGRVEHMASGDAIFFEDQYELLQFFKRVLSAADR